MQAKLTEAKEVLERNPDLEGWQKEGEAIRQQITALEDLAEAKKRQKEARKEEIEEAKRQRQLEREAQAEERKNAKAADDLAKSQRAAAGVAIATAGAFALNELRRVKEGLEMLDAGELSKLDATLGKNVESFQKWANGASP